MEKEKVNSEELSCVFQKKAIANPDRLLAGETFQEMLNYLREKFDCVILDTPPLGIVRDAEVVAERADAVLMVMRQDEDHAAALNDMIDMLENGNRGDWRHSEYGKGRKPVWKRILWI